MEQWALISNFEDDCNGQLIFIPVDGAVLNFKGLVLGIFVLISSIEAKYRKEVIHYPLDTQFFATDFFVKGCKNFLDRCPKAYKTQLICARSYDGDFRNFGNYCEMQYENCNTWKNWHVFKREKC